MTKNDWAFGPEVDAVGEAVGPFVEATGLGEVEFPRKDPVLGAVEVTGFGAGETTDDFVGELPINDCAFGAVVVVVEVVATGFGLATAEDLVPINDWAFGPEVDGVGEAVGLTNDEDLVSGVATI